MDSVSPPVIDLDGDTTDNGASKLVITTMSVVEVAARDCTRERVSKVRRDQRPLGRDLGTGRLFG